MTTKQEIKERKRLISELKTIREDKGITPTELAKICNIRRCNVYRVESGNNATTIDIIIRMANALGKKIEIVDKP